MASKVYFKEAMEEESNEFISDKLSELFEIVTKEDCFISEDDFTPIKIHFGEKNNTGHIKPGYIRGLAEQLKSKGAKPFLTDTNTLYEGERSNTVDHLKQAARHDFTLEEAGIPILIADGLFSKNYGTVSVNGRRLDEVKVAHDILRGDAFIALSHVTGHPVTCMGGTIKNVGMGCAPRSGKQQQHANVTPDFDQDACQECGRCVEWCPVGALSLSSDKAGVEIDRELCYGCGECVATCRFGAVSITQEGSSLGLQERMAEYALGTLKGFEGKALFFNFLTHIQKGCDCYNEEMKKQTPDLGILASRDPVAIDQASICLVNEQEDQDFFPSLWSDSLDYRPQIEHAEELGLGSTEYELIEV